MTQAEERKIGRNRGKKNIQRNLGVEYNTTGHDATENDRNTDLERPGHQDQGKRGQRLKETTTEERERNGRHCKTKEGR